MVGRLPGTNSTAIKHRMIAGHLCVRAQTISGMLADKLSQLVVQFAPLDSVRALLNIASHLRRNFGTLAQRCNEVCRLCKRSFG